MQTDISEFDSSLIGQRKLRLEKLAKLSELGFEAYPARAVKTQQNIQYTEDFATLENQQVSAAGRLMTIRQHGKLVFMDLYDQSGRVQIYVKEDELKPADTTTGNLGWVNLELLDSADFIQVNGIVTKTQRGEVSILAHEIKLLTKALRPLPTEFEDKELRYRRRYLDLALHPERRALFERKAKFWQANREFLNSKGFMEVETPVLEFVTGGADARPFTTHHNDLDQDFFLRISTELYQKRLIGAGFEKVFTLAPNFRNEGVSDEHLQEYYQCEWYWAYADYRDNMNLVKEMFRFVAQQVYGTTKFATRGHEFDLADEWQEIDYADIIRNKFNIDIFTSSDKEMLDVLQTNGILLTGDINRNRLIDNLWKVIRKTLSGPAFLINEPKFMSPLAKSRPDNPEFTERFHVIIGGSELGNGYSELNDPLDQLARFKEQQAARDAGDDESQMLDVDYVEMLEYGMPPTSGYGHSERVFWFLEDVTAREGTLFPQMRHEIDPVTKSIYPELKLD